MQTFLPFESFAESAKVLDRQRLGKQRVETMQIMNALLAPDEAKAGWRRHPATLMWEGHEEYLMRYQIAVCREWTEWRGYQDTCLEKTQALVEAHWDRVGEAVPPWLGREEFHVSHRSNLIRKDPDYYEPRFHPDTPINLEYMWPRGTARTK